jgi:hypothetical protein
MSTMALKSSALESSSVSRQHSLEVSATSKTKSDPSLKKTTRKARTIQFNKNVKVATIPHIKDFKKEDIQLIWYTTEEYTQCRESCMAIIRRMDEMAEKSGSVSHNTTNSSREDSSSRESEVSSRCTRGLESYTKTKSTQRRIRRFTATNAVLSEQHFQQEEGRHDPEFLRQAYQHITAPCHDEAHLIALQDEKEARRCYKLMELAPRVAFHGSAPLPSSTSTLQAANLSCSRHDRPRN